MSVVPLRWWLPSAQRGAHNMPVWTGARSAPRTRSAEVAVISDRTDRARALLTPLRRPTQTVRPFFPAAKHGARSRQEIERSTSPRVLLSSIIIGSFKFAPDPFAFLPADLP